MRLAILLAILLALLPGCGVAVQRFTRTEYLHVRSAGREVTMRGRAISGLVARMGRVEAETGFGAGYDHGTRREAEGFLSLGLRVLGDRWTWSAYADVTDATDSYVFMTFEVRY